MKRRLRKIMSIALAMLMTIGMMPMTAVATEPGQGNQSQLRILIDGCNDNGTVTKGDVEVKFYPNLLSDKSVTSTDCQMTNILGALSYALETVNGYDSNRYAFALRSDQPVPEGQSPFVIELAYDPGNVVFVSTDSTVTSVPENYDLHFEIIEKGGDQGGGGQTFNVDFGATGSWTVNNVNVTASMGGQAVNNVVQGMTADQEIALTGFDPDTMEVRVTEYGGNNPENPFWTTLSVDENGVTKIANRQNDGGIPNNLVFSVEEKGGGQGGQPGGVDVKIMLGCHPNFDGDSWTGVTMINHELATVAYADTYKMSNNNLCQGVCVYVLDDNQTSYDGARRDYSHRDAADGMIHFTYHGNSDTRKIVVATQWSDVLEAVSINGDEYSPFKADYATGYVSNDSPMDKYMDHFAGQMLYNIFEVQKTDDEVYKVDVAVRPLAESECKVGNFLWSDDPAFAGTGDDMYVDQAVMTMISMTYNGQTWSEEQILAGDCPYVGDYSPNALNHENMRFGSLFVPTGAQVTMNIIPNSGYQVKSFNLSGSDFIAESTPGQFTFTVGKGNFHMGASTVSVKDEIKATATQIGGATLDGLTAGGELEGGSALLSVADANPSADKVAEFGEAASKLDADIVDGKAYLAIDLNQVIYKANDRDHANEENEVWTTAIHSLGDGYVLATLTFGADTDVSTVVLVHNIGDGDEYEIIRPESYDTSKHTATFKMKSFSTFAIAQAHTKTVPVTPSNTSTNTNGGGSGAPAATTVDTVPKTAETFPIVPVMVVAIVSFATMAVVVFERKRRA